MSSVLTYIYTTLTQFLSSIQNNHIDIITQKNIIHSVPVLGRAQCAGKKRDSVSLLKARISPYYWKWKTLAHVHCTHTHNHSPFTHNNLHLRTDIQRGAYRHYTRHSYKYYIGTNLQLARVIYKQKCIKIIHLIWFMYFKTKVLIWH